MLVKNPIQIIDRELVANLNKLDDLKNVLSIDTVEIDALQEQIEYLKEQLAEAENKIANLRPGDGFQEAFSSLSQKRDDLAAMLQSTANELSAEIAEIRLAAYLDLLTPAVDNLNEITKDLDTEALTYMAKAVGIMQERFSQGERIKEIDRVAESIYDDLKGKNPTIPQLSFSSFTAWKQPQLADYRTQLGQNLDRFKSMAGVGGVPGDPDELYKWFARRGW